MDILTVAGCALIACVLVVIVRQLRPEMAITLSIAAGVIIFALILSALVPVIDELHGIIEASGTSGADLRIVVKAFGICLVGQLAGDVCRDAGQTSLATEIELGERIAVLAVSLPLFTRVLEFATQIIKG